MFEMAGKLESHQGIPTFFGALASALGKRKTALELTGFAGSVLGAAVGLCRCTGASDET